MVAQIDRQYLGLGLARTLRRLFSYGLFEGRQATTRGQWFNPLVFALLRVLALAPGQPRIDRPIFITGLGRSGTTILGLVLSVHHEVGFLNEPKAIWHVIDPRQDINGNFGGSAPRFRLGAADVSDAARQRAQRMFARYLGIVGATRLVDKYPEQIFRVPYIRALFPDARFIFIHRSGVDACQSIVRWSERLGRETADGTEDWWGRNDSKWRNLWAELIAADPEYGDIAALDPATLDHANRAAVEWIVTMREGLSQSRQNPDFIVRVRYEDLLDRPDTELRALLQACDLPHDAAVLDYARARLYENPAKPMPLLVSPVQYWFDRTMTDLGYET